MMGRRFVFLLFGREILIVKQAIKKKTARRLPF